MGLFLVGTLPVMTLSIANTKIATVPSYKVTQRAHVHSQIGSYVEIFMYGQCRPKHHKYQLLKGTHETVPTISR